MLIRLAANQDDRNDDEFLNKRGGHTGETRTLNLRKF